jgi:hypothetical protein
VTQRLYIGRWSSNPIVQVLSVLLFGIGLIVAVLMGAVILAFVVGFVIVAGIVLWIRVMWITRKMRRQGRRPPSDGRVIEVEYTVVDEHDRRDSARRDDH